MAKASGNTRTSSPSASSGPVVVKLKDNHGEYGAPVTIYGDAKEVVYDEHFVFITKNGNIHFADPDESLPKIKMDNVIFIESNDANSTYVWYDNKAADYKKKIYDKTGYRVL